MQHDEGDVGWASRSLDDALQRAEAGGMAVWQLAMIGAVAVSAVSVPSWVLMGAHLLVLAVGALIVVRGARAWPLLIAVYAVTLLDYRAVVDLNSALGLATEWTSILTAAIALLVVRGHRAWVFVAVSVAGTASGLLAWHGRHAGIMAAIPTAVTSAVLVVAALALMRALRGFAAETDAHEAAAAHEQEDLAIRRASGRAAAEHARVLHDTLINTLGAIAGGGGAIGDRALVREQSALDVAAVEALLDGDAQRPLRRLSAIVVPPGWRLERTGMPEAELDAALARLPAPVAAALSGAVGELVRNAVKHSGARRIVLDARREGPKLVVTVADQGRGFDAATVSRRGLAGSVVARAGGGRHPGGDHDRSGCGYERCAAGSVGSGSVGGRAVCAVGIVARRLVARRSVAR